RRHDPHPLWRLPHEGEGRQGLEAAGALGHPDRGEARLLGRSGIRDELRHLLAMVPSLRADHYAETHLASPLAILFSVCENANSMARTDELQEGNGPGWRQRAVSKSLSAARSRAEQRVQALLDAAFALIDESGTTQFTIQEVVDRSKQSLRGFYQYFESKDELLFALLEETIRESLKDLR